MSQVEQPHWFTRSERRTHPQLLKHQCNQLWLCKANKNELLSSRAPLRTGDYRPIDVRSLEGPEHPLHSTETKRKLSFLSLSRKWTWWFRWGIKFSSAATEDDLNDH